MFRPLWCLPMVAALLGGATAAAQVRRMPDLVGLPKDSAHQVLVNLKLRWHDNPIHSGTPRNSVARQSKAPTAPIQSGEVIELWISDGQQPAGGDDVVPPPDSVTVPPLIGSDRLAAGIQLAIAKLGLGQSNRVHDPAHNGKVIRQFPDAGTRVPKGSPVDLWYGYAQPMKVPNLIGLTESEAETALTGASLSGHVTYAKTPDGTGLVGGQQPLPGARLIEGGVVEYRVDQSALIPVPDVVGQVLGQARNSITKAGFVPGLVDSVESAPPAGVVLRQNPGAGTQAPPGSRIHLRVSVTSRLTTVPSVVGAQAGNAAALLADSGLVLGQVDSSANKAPAGQILSQGPIAGTRVMRGSAVRVRVARPIPPPDTVVPPPDTDVPTVAPQPPAVLPQSPGPTRPSSPQKVDSIAVPSLIGLRPGKATDSLAILRLGVQINDTLATYAERGLVLRQQPRAGTRVPPGTAVSLAVGAWVFPGWLRIVAIAVPIALLALLFHGTIKGRRYREDKKKFDRDVSLRTVRDPGLPTLRDDAPPIGGPELALEPKHDAGTTDVSEGEP